jgi:probable HAF family extracellular repeat protein
MTFARLVPAIVLASALATSPTAEATPTYPYKVVVLGAGSGSYGNAINKQGQVAGRLIPGAGDHAFLYANGVLTDLGSLPGNDGSLANGINNKTQVVGNTFGLNQASRAFAWSSGVMRDIGSLAGGVTQANDINDAGAIVGSSVLQVHYPFAFLYKDGLMRNLGSLPGSDRSSASAINHWGVIAGTSGVGPSQGPNGNQSHAVIWKNGHIRDLGTLGGLNSYGHDINELGQVTGYSSYAGGDYPNDHYGGFVWTNGRMRDIGAPPGGNQVQPHAINNLGQVVGLYHRSGQERAFLYGYLGGIHDLNTLVDPAQGWWLVSAHDINDWGQITGMGCTPSGFCTAVRLDPWYKPQRVADGVGN